LDFALFTLLNDASLPTHTSSPDRKGNRGGSLFIDSQTPRQNDLESENMLSMLARMFHIMTSSFRHGVRYQAPEHSRRLNL
jgi:hypothetical protein